MPTLRRFQARARRLRTLPFLRISGYGRLGPRHAGEWAVQRRAKAVYNPGWFPRLRFPLAVSTGGFAMLHAWIGSLGLFLTLAAPDAPADERLQTVAERSGFQATARYEEVVALGRRLAETSKQIHLDELGKTTEGRSIPVLILADPPVKTPEAAARSGKLVVLVLGNIHGGEVCGKEALPMLAREILGQEHHPLLTHLIIALVPIYNADGNEKVAQDNRPGQNGPEQGVGQRANAQGLDLNRDFMKLEAPETRALVRFLNRWDPALVIDTHTTNGSYHRYTISYDGPKNPAGDPHVIAYTRETMLPAITRAFEERTGLHAFFYGNFNRDHTQWTTYPALPRFGTTYVGLRNRLSILSEAYAYAPFETRVKATRDFVRASLQYVAEHKDEIRKLLDDARRASQTEQRVAIRSEAKPFQEPVTILGFVEEERDGRKVATKESKDYRVQLVQKFEPTTTVKRPFGYLIPRRYATLIATLQRHGIELDVLREDIDLDVEIYEIHGVSRTERGYVGQTIRVEASPKSATRRVPAGTFLVRAAQPLGTLAVYLLEPESDDGFAASDTFGEDLMVGTEYPILRLAHSAPLLTAAARPLADERPQPQPITLKVLEGQGRFAFNGSPAVARWEDNEHLLQLKEGQLMRVEAETGQAKPAYDIDAITQALATLPTIDRSTARVLVRAAVMRRGPQSRWAMPGHPNDPVPSNEPPGLLIDHDNDLYFVRFDGSKAERLTSTPSQEELASFSPDGRFVAFVRDNNLWVVDLQTRTERAMTTDGSATLRNGKADWVYGEEIFNRRSDAYWWSPDSKRIAFLQFDDAPVPLHTLVDPLTAGGRVEQTAYPRAGDPNPDVRLGVVTVAGGPVHWVDLSGYLKGAFLISDVGWWPDGSKVFAYVQDRIQTWLDFMTWSAEGDQPHRLLRDSTQAWIESPGRPAFLDDGSFLLASERDGWRHLYHFGADGTLRRQVTKGEWEVRALHLVDQKNGWIYVSGTKDSSIMSHLYRVKLDGSQVERLTRPGGTHQVAVSPDGRRFVDEWSDIHNPPRVALFATDGSLIRMIDTNPVRALEQYIFAPRELVQITTKDGFTLEGELILPPDLSPAKLYPVWFTTYGGPHAPSVSDSWAGGRAWEQMLAQEGILVFRVDPRTASGKGARSAWAGYRKLGLQELADIREAIAWLKTRPYVDGARIGMSGHSYGGFMTAFALTHSDLFAAGIAGAPVTDWHDYDSIYTERYMSTPQDNPDGYRATSVVEAAKNLHGRLLILHGVMDDNVSPRNSLKLIHALQQADKDFELMLYPPSRHGIFGPHYSRLMVEFIRRTLGGPRDRARSEGSPQVGP
jgi:dipeptidyl-peptidase-4